ncbi:MAG: twin-arginine translocase TatA/TatE family subunit [Acidobacteria bacterium]|jgi:sec-independent protein translocase protein TatA|nr:twin-arginine translocase TatA/TatE family subunit [Acidobacteriota bacterium]
MFGTLGMTELLIILFIVILLFGAKRLPELGKSVAVTIKNFKNANASDASDADDKKDS